MNALERDKVLTVRMTADERAMLRAIAERSGVTASDWVRLTIRQTYADTFGDKQPKPRKR